MSQQLDNEQITALIFSAQQGAASLTRENTQLVEYVAGQRKQIMRLVLVVLALTVLLVAMLVVFMFYPKNRYIATKDNKAICAVEPTKNPNLTDC